LLTAHPALRRWRTITAGAPSILALGYWAVLAALLVALAAAAWRIREQQRTQR
jgi:hypothetical protein